MSSKKKQGGGGGVKEDERFLRVQKDPRFWEMPEREIKVKIDKRFQSMFTDKRFKVKYTVDKRGRPINHTSTEDLRRFYKLSDSEEEEEEEEEEERKKKKKKKKVREKSERAVEAEKELKKGKKARAEQPTRGVRVLQEDEDDDDEDDDEEEQAADREELGDSMTDGSEEEEEDDDDVEAESGSEEAESGSEEAESGVDSSSSEEDSDSELDLARGKGNIETSSDEDEEDDVDEILRREEEEIEHDWGELCKDARRGDEVSSRLALCNMDWDRIKAKDLLALFSSFKPKGGVVLSVKIYPSEFGKERMQLEETQGPLELRALPDDTDDDTEEDRVYREKMRDYQFKRLKYYYAVVECDSADTAAKIYEECDGFEYESSCSVLDLRFIPDDVAFEDEPRDVASDVDLSAYTPKLFTSSATATSKVQLTWDETDHERVTAMSRKFNKNELLDMDFNAYLASSSEEDEEEEEQEVNGDADETAEAEPPEEGAAEIKPPEEEKRKKTMKKNSAEQIAKYREILKSIQEKDRKLQEDKDMEMEITWVPGLKETTEQLVKKKLEGSEQLTPWEEFLQKKKDKKKQKKARKKQAEAESQLSDDELPPDVDLSDPFFAEELGAAGAEQRSQTKGKKKKKKKKEEEEEEERTAEEEEELQKQKAEMALLMEDEDDAKHKHFNYDKIVEQQNLSKRKRKKLQKKSEEPLEDDDFQVDVEDPRFQAMFTSHLFNLDPSHPGYKNTKATRSIQAEKQRRRQQQQRHLEEELGKQEASRGKQEAGAGKQEEASVSAPKKTMDPSLSLLVKSIKSKTEQFQARKKQKVV
ncbi:ESF1 homolog [Myripristis murdjan]|uniref:ESF1, nucleolar pre-rRNA processing protein, homolog (S. cerevisiae) n=1 Tax=Myripristis murdjan TaxID=586833 RepID=A0A667XWV1_9TELE|nr:ESF1 homolog [Myripristis murdjan]XP_029901050.1 ESF1 homolog [Myripristis murdjan]XP_029937602.1 ESF1 homolog [Myripristis murdjan]